LPDVAGRATPAGRAVTYQLLPLAAFDISAAEARVLAESDQIEQIKLTLQPQTPEEQKSYAASMNMPACAKACPVDCIYIEKSAVRKVEKVQGELYNVEFATFEAVKDPLKIKR
jgi:ferredoxin